MMGLPPPEMVSLDEESPQQKVKDEKQIEHIVLSGTHEELIEEPEIGERRPQGTGVQHKNVVSYGVRQPVPMKNTLSLFSSPATADFLPSQANQNEKRSLFFSDNSSFDGLPTRNKRNASVLKRDSTQSARSSAIGTHPASTEKRRLGTSAGSSTGAIALDSSMKKKNPGTGLAPKNFMYKRVVPGENSKEFPIDKKLPIILNS